MATKYQYIVDLVLNSKEFQKGMADHVRQVKQAESAQMKVRGALKQVASTVGLAYSATAIVKFAAESVALAAKAEGVRAAFNKLDDPNLLNKLRSATRGTVSDVDLMTRAVEARNFKISMESLPKYFEFASARAIETGQSIDYLVQSLVTGVGRKSVLWLDNLGLSITEINEELQKTPDFAEAVGKVIERDMAAAGEVASTTATEVQKLSSHWANFKEQLGTLLTPALGAGLDNANFKMEVMGDKALTFGQKLKALFVQDKEDYYAAKTAVEQYFATLSKEGAEWELKRQSQGTDKDSVWKKGLAESRLKELQLAEKAAEVKEKDGRTLKVINEELRLQRELLDGTNTANKDLIASTVEKINALEAEKKAIEDLLNVTKKSKVTPHGLESLVGGKFTPAIQSEKPKEASLLTAFGIDPTQLEGMNEILERSKDNIDKNAEAWKKYAEVVAEKKEAINGMFTNTASILSSIASVTDEGTAGWLNFAAKTLETIPTLITQVVALQSALTGQAISGAVAGANTLPPPLNLIAMGVSIAATLAALATSVPKFAEGGIISGPTLGMMGEYPGAKSDPEIVAPLSKLSKMIQPALTEGEVVFRIGEDALYGQLRRYEKKRANIR